MALRVSSLRCTNSVAIGGRADILRACWLRAILGACAPPPSITGHSANSVFFRPPDRTLETILQVIQLRVLRRVLGNIAWADLEPCPFQKRNQCLRAFLIGYARIFDAFGCCCRCLHLLLLDRVDPVDESSLSGTIALGRKPTLLTHQGLNRWKGGHLVSFSHRDRPIGFLQSQSLGTSRRHATRPATRVAGDTLAEPRLSGRPPVADLIVTWQSL